MHIDYRIKRYCNNTSKFKKSGKLIQCNYAQFLQGQSHIYISILKSEFCMIIFHDYGLIVIPHMYISYNSQSFTSQTFVVFTKNQCLMVYAVILVYLSMYHCDQLLEQLTCLATLSFTLSYIKSNIIIALCSITVYCKNV